MTTRHNLKKKVFISKIILKITIPFRVSKKPVISTSEINKYHHN